MTSSSSSNFKCQKCEDKGYIIVNRFPLITEECDCEIQRRLQRRIKRSGLEETMKRCTFDNFQTADKWQEAAKEKAAEYLSSPKGTWFFIGGQPGSGKTHLCTAICGEFINRGVDMRYMKWRETMPRLKAAVNDTYEFNSIMDPLKTCKLLYIDDFLKGTVTDADINLAYELINYRYNERLRTVISGERSIQDILSLDEATGSRIFELAKGYVIQTPKNANWRLK